MDSEKRKNVVKTHRERKSMSMFREGSKLEKETSSANIFL